MSHLVITGFEILEKLGEGGMASVWKARQLSLDRVVAIKVMSSRLASDPADVRRFQSEAQSAAKLKHPGIVQVYDANAEGGLYYFVMEYVAGYTVGDWVRRKGALPEKDALLVVEAVADALQYAWDNQRIIHCDIKPDNVMVDADGSVKVADLGLARTLNAMRQHGQAESEEVMGTPAYISPEQARGSAALDCRADIYSLGAMLYHLVTGHLMFEGQPDEKVIELQIADQVDDAMDVNPHVTKPMAWMIEKMLAKECSHRTPDWATVRADIARVKRGLAPSHRLDDRAASTMRRSKHRLHPDTHVPSHAHSAAVKAAERAEADAPVRRLLMPVALLAAAVLGGMIVVGKYRQHVQQEAERKPPAVAPRPAPPTSPAPAAHPYAEQDAADMYGFAMKMVAEHPSEYTLNIRNLEKVARQAAGTKYALMAEAEVRKIREKVREETGRVIKDIDASAAPLVAEGRYAAAAELYENYKGILSLETTALRRDAAQGLRDKQAESETAAREAQVRGDAKMAALLEQMTTAIASNGMAMAIELAARAIDDADLAGRRDELRALRGVVEGAAKADETLAASLLAQKGQRVTLSMAAGEASFVLTDVKEGRIEGSEEVRIGEATASRNRTVQLRDLSLQERLNRAGPDDAPDAALARGVMACNARQYADARLWWGRTHPALVPGLLARLDVAERVALGQDAEKAFLKLLQVMGINMTAYDREALLQRLAVQNPAAGNPALVELVNEYRRKYGATDFGLQLQAVLSILSGAPTDAATPATDASTTAVPAGDALRAQWVQRIIEKNPGVAPELIELSQGSDGSVQRVQIISGGAADLSFVSGMPGLRAVAVGGVPADDFVDDHPIASLSDISALAGLPLEYAYLGLTSIRDLSPLRGAGLRELHIRNTAVADLTPLKGMALTKLDLRNTKVRDLAPLKGLPLSLLNLSGTGVYDFRPLSGMPLEWLDVSSTQVKDVTFVHGMPLRGLSLANTGVFNFTPLKELRLQELLLTGTQVRELSFLAGMPLNELNVGGTGVADLAPLRNLPVNVLVLERTPIKDLSALKGLPLKDLDIGNCRVSDLAPLAGMPLERLIISGTQVSDLSPLRGMPLVELQCQNMALKDFSPLAGMPIEVLWVDPGAVTPKFLVKSLPLLREVNGETLSLPEGDPRAQLPRRDLIRERWLRRQAQRRN